MRRRSVRRPSQVVVIPAREFFNKVIVTNSLIPQGMYLNEVGLIGAVFDYVFNNLDFPLEVSAETFINNTPYVGVDDLSYAQNLLSGSFDLFTELLGKARDDAKNYIPSYNYLDLVRISWDTKSLYMKVL